MVALGPILPCNPDGTDIVPDGPVHAKQLRRQAWREYELRLAREGRPQYTPPTVDDLEYIHMSLLGPDEFAWIGRLWRWLGRVFDDYHCWPFC